MPDLYQIPLDMPRGDPEYLRWEKLNFILRQLFEVVSNIDGRLHPISYKNDLEMGGNQISAGPSQQTLANTDYVTKSYLQTTEFGRMVVGLLVATGKTPLPVTGSAGSGGGGGGTSDHALLTNLAYAASLHTGFVPATRTITTTAPLSGGGDLSANRTIAISQAGVLTDGYLSLADWNIFNAKQGALSFGNLTELTSTVLTIAGGTGAVIGAGATITVKQASGAQSGYLSSGDWTAFNAKQNALSLGNLTESTSAVLTITGGTGATVGNVTIQVALASAASPGYLSAANWSTFNGKVGGSGTTGNIPKFTAASTIGDSIIKESAAKIGVGTTGAPAYKLEVEGQIKATLGSILPAVKVLVDAATIATDASLANHFRVTVGGDRTLGNPSNAVDGQRIIWEITQDATGNRLLTLDSKFSIPSNMPDVILSLGAGKTDMIGVVYNATLDRFIITGFMKEYA